MEEQYTATAAWNLLVLVTSLITRCCGMLFHSSTSICRFSTTSTLSHCISDVAANSSLTPVPSPLSATETRVRLELQQEEYALRRLRCVQDCLSVSNCVNLHGIFNLNLQMELLPTQWKTSCIVSVPKITCPAELNDYRPMTLTWHIMKILE